MKSKKLAALVLICLFSVTFISSCSESKKESSHRNLRALPADTEFDLVILNGRVMDPETNFDGIRNVGVKDGKIAIITEADYFW